MTREEIEKSEEDAQVEEAFRESEALFEADDIGNLEQVKVRVSKPVRHVFSLKIGADELDLIADAAEAAGVSVGAFIRDAALEKAAMTDHEGEADIETELKALAQRLSSITERLRSLSRHVPEQT
jgi:hypothetical protein